MDENARTAAKRAEKDRRYPLVATSELA